MVADISGPLSFARVAEMPRYLRRAIGLRYSKPEDFNPKATPEDLARARDIVRRTRGEFAPPAILVLGVMPRSGTNFVHDVIGLHPHVRVDPGRIYEFPLLHVAAAAKAFQEEFLAVFPRNAEVIGRWDALAYLSGAWMRDLQRESGEQRMLLKNPHVQNLSLLGSIFPGDKIVLVLRDGRDVVESSLKTFKGEGLKRKNFSQLTWEWRDSADAILEWEENGPRRSSDVMVLRYEDMLERPDETLPRLLNHLELDPNLYDRAAFDALPVRGSSKSTAADGSQWKPQERSADFNPLRRWETWPAGRKAKFKRIAGDTLTRCGYDAMG